MATVAATAEARSAGLEPAADKSPERGNERWRSNLARGGLGILFGAIFLAFPFGALFGFSVAFAAYAVMDGATSIAAGWKRVGIARERSWPLLLRGFVGIAIGVAFVLMPMVAAFGYVVAAVLLLCLWAMLSGVLEIAAAIRLADRIEGEWLLAASGLLSLLLGLAVAILIFAYPAGTLLFVAWLLGSYALGAGILLVAQGLLEKRRRPATSPVAASFGPSTSTE